MKKQKRAVLIQKDYNPKEPVIVTNSNNCFVSEVEKIALNSSVFEFRDAVVLIGEFWNLRPNRAKEFKIIRQIIIKSIICN